MLWILVNFIYKIFFSASCNHLEKLALGDIEATELDGADINDILKSAATLKVFQMAFNNGEIPIRAFKKLVTNLTELTDLSLQYKKVELVSEELNHLAAILHVYAGGLIFMK